MTPTRILSFQIIKGVLILNVVILAILFLIGKATIGILVGMVFGSFFSILNFRLLAITIEKCVTMPPHRAQAYMVSRFFLRMFFTGAVIVISLRANHIDVIGTLIGLILPSIYIKTSSLLSNISNKIKKRKEA